MLAEDGLNIEPTASEIPLRVDLPKAIGVLLLFMNAILRSSRQVLITILILLCAAWASGEAYQWLLRWRAGKLLADVRSLEVNRSQWPDAQKMMARWGRWSVPKASCTTESCVYQINLIQSLPPILGGYPGKGVKNWLPKIVGHLGLRGAAARAGFTVEHGIVTSKWFGEQVTLPVQDWNNSGDYVPYLSVSSGGFSRFHQRASEFPHLHPNRMVQAYPHGLNVMFDPQEDPSEQALLLDYRFSCFTQLRPCRSEGDMLPEGWRMLQEQQIQSNTR
jgi:hypothetical protein